MSGESNRSLHLTRRFDASVERVFDAWLNPEIASRWLFTTPVDQVYTAKMEASVGGKWTITARRAGIDYTAIGEYLEIDRPHRLVFTFGMPQFSPNNDRITVEFTPSGSGCLMTFTQQGIDIDAELRQIPEGGESGSERGWKDMFDLLAIALK